LGIVDDLRSHFGGTRCERLVSYDSKVINISGVRAGAGGFTLNFGGVSIDTKKIREASGSAQALDNFQYDMCNLSRRLPKGNPRYLRLFDLQAAVICIITSFRMTLESFSRDPEAAGRQLDHIFAKMQELCDFLVDQSVKGYPPPEPRFGGVGAGPDPVDAAFDLMGVTRTQIQQALL